MGGEILNGFVVAARLICLAAHGGVVALRPVATHLLEEEGYALRELGDHVLTHDEFDEREYGGRDDYTVIPDLRSVSREELEPVDEGRSLAWIREILCAGEEPHAMRGEDVDVILWSMYEFPVIHGREAAEDAAVTASRDLDHDYVPARLDTHEPYALMYAGPRAFSTFRDDGPGMQVTP